MALFDNGLKLGTGLALGVGAFILAPVVIPTIAALAKPLVKAGIKGGLMLYDRSIVAIAEAKEVIEDLTAEAKSDLSQEQATGAAAVIVEPISSSAE